MLSGIFLEDQTWHHLWSRMPHFHRHAMLSVIPSFVFWGLISSFLVSVAGRLLAQDACEDTPTHTLTCRLMCTNKCRLKHMRSDHLCVMTRTEDGRFIWLREKNNQIKEEVREGERACSLFHLIDLTLIQRGRFMTHQRQIHISFPLSIHSATEPSLHSQ